MEIVNVDKLEHRDNMQRVLQEMDKAKRSLSKKLKRWTIYIKFMNSNEVVPVRMSSCMYWYILEEKQEILQSILKEESMVNITLKPTDQEVFLAEEPHAALLKLKCFQELNNKERLFTC